MLLSRVVVLGVVLMPAVALAQGSKVGVVNFERGVVESAEGKKAADQFNAKLEERRKDVEKRQKELEDIENKLRTQERALSETARADLAGQIDRRRTELTRVQEDAQKELDALRQQLLRPISEVAGKVLNALAAEQGFTVIIDTSNPQTNVLYINPANDLTSELIRRVDAALKKP